jgi:phosphate:Na+ symporter
MFNSIFANLLAGLGLFFSGLRIVDDNLRHAAGRQLRVIVGRVTRYRSLAGALGLMTGAVVQSSSAIVFILASLVSSGLATVRQALPIVTWANVGTSALIFAAVLDLRMGVLYLLGIAGAAFAFDRTHRSHALGAIFGVGMLFYGIELMKAGADPLKEMSLFSGLLSGKDESYLLAFAIGTALSFVTQSSSAVSILVIGLAQTGLMGPYPAMMALYGANLGSTGARMLLSSSLRGSVRQLTAFQDLFKISGAAIFVGLVYAEALLGIPLVRALAESLSSQVERQMACVFLIFNLTMAIAFTVAQEPILRLLTKLVPSNELEDWAKPAYLYDEALSDPATALDLIEKEQVRVAKRLRMHSEAMRSDAGSPERAKAAAMRKPFATVVEHIDHFQRELVKQQLDSAETERLTTLQNRLSLIIYLEDSLATLAASTAALPPDNRLAELMLTFVDALDFVLMTLIDALEGAEPESLGMLLQVTEDRSDLMERIRQEYLAEETSVGRVERVVLLQVTSLFERIMWMARRLALLIEGVPQLNANDSTAESRTERVVIVDT